MPNRTAAAAVLSTVVGSNSTALTKYAQ